MLRKLRDLTSTVPFNALLGIRLERLHRDGVTVGCRLCDDLLNSAGVAHGGVAAALADAAVGIAILRRVKGKRPITTVELKVNYLEPMSEGRMLARARLLRVGATLAVGTVELTDSKARLIGTAIVTYLFLDARGNRSGKGSAIAHDGKSPRRTRETTS
jgi:acyl-CoA thioesterase